MRKLITFAKLKSVYNSAISIVSCPFSSVPAAYSFPPSTLRIIAIAVKIVKGPLYVLALEGELDGIDVGAKDTVGF